MGRKSWEKSLANDDKKPPKESKISEKNYEMLRKFAARKLAFTP